MCLNRKVLFGIGAVALVLFAIDPSLLGHVFPLLLFAVCPLSMVFMMRGMRKTGGTSGNGQSCGMSSGSMGTADMGQPGVARTGSEHEDEVIRLRAELDQLRAARTQGKGATWR